MTTCLTTLTWNVQGVHVQLFFILYLYVLFHVIAKLSNIFLLTWYVMPFGATLKYWLINCICRQWLLFVCRGFIRFSERCSHSVLFIRVKCFSVYLNYIFILLLLCACQIKFENWIGTKFSNFFAIIFYYF